MEPVGYLPFYFMKHLTFQISIFLLLLISTTTFAQTEHGLLIGGGVGFPMQDSRKSDWNTSNLGYNHDLKGNGMIGYRVRFLPERKSFFDLDATIGFQSMSTYQYSPFFEGDGDGNYGGGKDGKSFTDFIMPISVAASWNYRLTDKFHFGLGVTPTLYVQPQAVFDLSIMAKVGYRLSKHCELGLSYQYGCLNTLKHFNDGPALGRRGHLSDLMLSVYIPFVTK